MDLNQVISNLKKILSRPTADGQVDVEAIHGELGQLNDREYIEIAKAAFSRQLETGDKQCKSIFGIAISYARDDPTLKVGDWKQLQNDMQAAVNAHNARNTSDKVDWNRLPPDLAASKTMVFTIVNRQLMGGIVANLRQGLGTAAPSSIRGAQSPSRGKV